MPPSPVMRVSPGRDLRIESHKRGRSLESGILYQENEDDLALFNEVGNKERDGFLLQSNENFDEFFSTKLRCFSGYKLGVSVPAQGESGDLLNVDRDKNDYDWLITPPETPLFRSLDDEAQPVKLAPMGRLRSQPVSISQSTTMEKDYRSGRGGASPHRLSPSPRSGNSPLQSRSRLFSANHSSPPPTMRHTSPARKLSPPSKPTYAPRSSTPAPRRISTGTSSPSRVRGSSPINTSRGNSASPKIRAWQTDIPGFSSEAPPNLRTSLADKPTTYVRAASPASRSSSRYGKQSMSPTSSRSVGSSHSREQDLFSPYSKGSVAMSADDDVDSSDQSAPRNIDAHSRTNATTFSRKPMKKLSSSAPKRSFDLVRQMDRNGPHNMFRPLLSSVPSSTFHAGKTSSYDCSLASRNSSITTSSNASCDQAASGAHDTEGSELNQEDVTTDCVRGNHSDMDEGVFVMEHGDNTNEDTKFKVIDVRSSDRFDVTVAVDYPDMVLDREHECLDGNCAPDTILCSKCGGVFHSAEIVMKGDLQLCLNCRYLDVRSTRSDPPNIVMDDILIIDHRSQEVLDQSATSECVQLTCTGLTGKNHLDTQEVLDQSASTSECLQLTCTGRTGKNHLETQNSYSDLSHSLSVEVFEEGEPTLACEKVIQQFQLDGINSSSKFNVSEGAGICLLLKRSSSVERHIVQSRICTASPTSYDDFSYVRDSLNSTRSSMGRTSASVSSSIDLGSSRQTELCNIWQSSGHKSDTENYQYDMPTKLNRSVSSVSSASGNMFQVPPSFHKDGYEEITSCINKELVEETRVDPHEQLLASEFTEAGSICSDVESNIVSKPPSELSSRLINEHSGEQASHENTDNMMNNSHNLSIAETSSLFLATANQVDDASATSSAYRKDAAEVHIPSSLNSISEKEIVNEKVAYYGSHSNDDSTSEFQLHGATSAVRTTAKEFEISHHTHVILESHFLLENMGQAKAKILTLEEAADAILFCSSIIHNLAYEAASFAIDNEALPVPAVTLVGKSNFERRDTSLRKRSSRSQKARKKGVEMDTMPSSSNAETNEKSSPCADGPFDGGAPDDSHCMKPPKLESKCNCLIM